MSPRPSRRTVLSSLALAPLAGCLEEATSTATDDDSDGPHSTADSAGSSAADADSIADRFDCEEASRPSPDVEEGIEVTYKPDDTDASEGDDAEPQTFESVGSADYPDPPESLEEHSIRTYLADHEGVYRRNERVSRYEERLTHFDANVDGTEVLEENDDVTTMRVELLLSDGGVDEEFGPWEGHELVAAAYAIDETGLVRAEANHSDGSDGDDDPEPLEEGELVVCFA